MPIKPSEKKQKSLLVIRKYDNKSSVSENKSVIDKFKMLHPDYIELIEWNKKVAYLDTCEVGMSSDEIMRFILGKGETNFQIVSKLFSSIVLEEVSKQHLYNFVSLKITEVKLEKELLMALNSFTVKERLEFLISGAANNIGKKAIRYLELLEKIEVSSEFISEILLALEIIKYNGINEKKKLNSVIHIYKSMPDKINTELKNDDEEAIEISHDVTEEENKQKKEKEILEVPEECTRSNNIEKQTSEKISIEVSDYYPVFDVSNYSAVIDKDLSRKNEVFYNDLLLFMIKNEIILNEEQAFKMIEIAISKRFYEQIALVDRIYPLSKLYTILRYFINKDDNIGNILCKMVRRQVSTTLPDCEIIKLCQMHQKFIDIIQKLLPPTESTSYCDSSVDLYREYKRSLDGESMVQSQPAIEEDPRELSMSVHNISLDNFTEPVDDNTSRVTKKPNNVYEQLKEIHDKKDLIEFFQAHRHEIDINRMIGMGMKDQIGSLLKTGHVDFQNYLDELFDLLINDSDSLIFLVINGNFCQTLKVLFKKIFEKSTDSSILILKLIWRHSKEVPKRMDNCVKIEALLATLDYLYSTYGQLLNMLDDTSIKVSLLHLQEICILYSSNTLKFNCSKRLKSMIKLLLSKKSLNLDKIRTELSNYYC